MSSSADKIFINQNQLFSCSTKEIYWTQNSSYLSYSYSLTSLRITISFITNSFLSPPSAHRSAVKIKLLCFILPTLCHKYSIKSFLIINFYLEINFCFIVHKKFYSRRNPPSSIHPTSPIAILWNNCVLLKLGSGNDIFPLT